MKRYLVSGIDGDGHELVSDFDLPTIKDAVIRARNIAKTSEYLEKGLYAVQIYEELSEKEFIWELLVKKGI